MKIPLAEHFHSIQGEGTWVGTPMHFIRLPGCSVGKFIPQGQTMLFPDHLRNPPILSSGRPAWLCHRFDDQPFWCDTDFNKYTESTTGELILDTWEKHICITGGEPLIHPEEVLALAKLANDNDIMVHIETSGTIEYAFPKDSVWITCSPKQNWKLSAVEEADELKLLVDSTFPTNLPLAFLQHDNVYVSPINRVETASDLNEANLYRCMELLKLYPHWKLSVQLHKYLNMR